MPTLFEDIALWLAFGFMAASVWQIQKSGNGKITRIFWIGFTSIIIAWLLELMPMDPKNAAGAFLAPWAQQAGDILHASGYAVLFWGVYLLAKDYPNRESPPKTAEPGEACNAEKPPGDERAS